MFFTYAARIVAVLAFAFGLLNLLGTIAIDVGSITPPEAALRRYFGNSTIGHAIDRSAYTALFGIALGTLSEISFHLRRLRQVER